MNRPLDTSLMDRFEELQSGPYFESVTAANRAYLDAAVPDAPVGAGERWVLTCLPKTKSRSGHRRLSAVSMRNMETFVLRVDPAGDAATVEGFVIVRRLIALQGFDGLDAMVRDLGLDDVVESAYQSAGPDQLRLAGSSEDLVRALGNPYIADAARELAKFLATSNTVYARYHNAHLTNATLHAHPHPE